MRQRVRFALAGGALLIVWVAIILAPPDWFKSAVHPSIPTSAQRVPAARETLLSANRVIAITNNSEGTTRRSTLWNDRWFASSMPEPAFVAFGEWCRKYIDAATPEKKSALEPDGVALARERRAAVAALIQSNPQRALELAVPIGLRRALPKAVVELLEERVSARGSLAVLGALAEPGREGEVRPVVRVARVNGESYDAFVYGKRLGETTRWDLSLQGIVVDRLFAVHESPVRVLEPEEAQSFTALSRDALCAISGNPSTLNQQATAVELAGQVIFLCGSNHLGDLEKRVSAAEGDSAPTGGFTSDDPEASAWTEGEKRLIVIRIDFPDLTGISLTDSGITNLVNGLDNFYREMSFGRASFARLGTGSEHTPVFRMPRNASYYGTNNYYDALRSDARNAASAAGYTLGNFDRDVICFGAVPGWGWAGLGYIGAAGTWLRNSFGTGVAAHELGHNWGLNHANYWDTSGRSVIGAGTSVEYGDSFDTMGSASAGNNHFNTRYKSYLNWLTASEVQTVSSSGTYRIFAHDNTNSTGLRALKIARDASTNYWVEFRQKFTSNKWMMSGAGIRRAMNGNQRSELLDTTPGSTDAKNDSAVVIGRTFSDVPVGIHVTPIRKGGTSPESLDVVVNLGTFPGNVDPSVAVSATATAVAVNATVTFTASAADANGDALAYYWDFGDGTFGTNGAAAVKSWTAAGDYVVQCLVTDMKGGLARDSVVVRVGSPATYQLTGTVTVDGFPVQGARIDVSSTRMTWSDSDGTYTLVGLPAGSYTVNASLDGYSFTNSGFSNPIALGPDATGIDFISGSSTRGVTITGPANNAAFAAPASIAISANASAGIGRTISKVEVFASGQKVGEDSTVPYSITWSNVGAGTYSLIAQVLDSVGATMTSAPVNLTVTLQPPSISAHPQSQTIATGGSATFAVTASGSAPLACQWRLNGTNVSGATNGLLNLVNVQPALAGGYTVVITNAAGSVTSSVAMLTVVSPPAITSQPQSLSVLSGAGVTFSVTASGAAPLSYQWRYNGGNISGNAARNASYTLNNVQASRAGDYTVVVSNSGGSITSAVAVLTVDAPPAITAQPQSQTVAAGTNAAFAVSATGAAPLTYQWRREGVALPGSTNSVLLLPAVQQTSAGNYTVMVSNPLGSTTSAAATLTVTSGTSSNLFKLLAVSLLPNRQAQLTISGNAGERYSIEASTNLLDWSSVGSTTNANGTVQFIDPGNTGVLRCFYRARLLP
jgi:hypothetical protein